MEQEMKWSYLAEAWGNILFDFEIRKPFLNV